MPTPTTSPSPQPSPPVTLLILGYGWTAHHLLPLLSTHNLDYALTTRTGHDSTIPFLFDPDSSSDDLESYKRLPSAETVLVTFPLKGLGQSGKIVGMYESVHGDGGGGEGDGGGKGGKKVRWIQLGSSSIYTSPGWNDSRSPYNKDNERAVAEDELLSLCGARACVLNLAGLYGGAERRPRDWVGRVVKCKADVKGKGALHLVHGSDVARGVVGVLLGWEKVGGRRWIVCDLRCYDWWELVMSWGFGGEGGEEGRRWVVELMREEGVRALPREKGQLGRVLDGRAFWEAIGSWPGEGMVT